MLHLIAVLLFATSFQWINAQVVEIKGTQIDHAMQKFPFPPLNNNSTVNTSVGIVQAQDKSNPQAKITYALLDVTLKLKNGTRVNGKPAERPSWQSLARDIERDDCKVSNLASYPELRQYFCIDHTTGEVFITKFFNQNIPSGSIFTFNLQYSYGKSITYGSPPPFYTVIFSNCDLMTQYYVNMTNLCQTVDIYEQHVVKYQNPLSSGDGEILVTVMPDNSTDLIHYLGIVQVDNPILNVVDITDNLYISIKLTHNGKMYSKTLPYSSPVIYRFQIEEPIKVQTNDAVGVNLSIKLLNDKTNLIYKGKVVFSLHYVKNRDFCTNSGLCNTLATQYYNSFKENMQDCEDIDEYLFYAKYGYCEDNLLPSVTKTRANLYSDLQEETREPIHVLSNYVYDTSDLRYSLQDVTAKFGNSGKMIKPEGHSDCTTSSLPTTTPMAYFCLNENTGSIYTTRQALRAFSPDEVFNLTIKILDTKMYPPRSLDLQVTVYVKSNCTKTTSLYRHFYDKKCNKEYYEGTLTKVPDQKSTITVKVNVPNLLPGETYYITGIKKLTSLSNHVFGSYREFFLQQGTDVIVTQHHFTGQFSSFNDTIRHKTSNKYHISSFFHDVTGAVASEDFDVTKWVLILMIDKDYCTNQRTCVNRFERYFTQYNKDLDKISKYCADPDIIAGKFKYGQCNKSSEIISTGLEYVLDIDKGYTLIEAIPSSSNMYTENPGLVYYLKEVKKNGILVNASESIDASKAPASCDIFNLYFCMNSINGFIYTTEIISGMVKVNDLFEFHIAMEDLRVIPKREGDVTVTLRVINKCAPASKMYGELSTCVNYRSLSAANIRKQEEIVFHLPSDFVKVLFLRIDLNNNPMQLQTSTISINANVKILYKNETTSKILFTSKAYLLDASNEYIDMTLNVMGVNKKESVLITLSQQASSDSPPSVVPVNSKSSFVLNYVENFNCGQSCVNEYLAWKDEASKKDPACQVDHHLYAANFDVCLDPEASFLSVPSITNNIQTGDRVVIGNCKYHAPYEFLDSYWLKDGLQRFNASVDGNQVTYRARRSVVDYPNLPLYDVGDLQINTITLDDYGYYQCVTKTGNKVFKSERVLLKLTDVFETGFVADLSHQPWNPTLSDKSSSDYQVLATDVIEQIENALNGNLQTSPKKVVVNNFFSSGESSITTVDGIIFAKDRTLTQNLATMLADELSIATNIQLSNTNYCEFITEGDENFKGRYDFLVTFVNSFISLDCQYGSEVPNAKIQRYCFYGPSNKPVWSILNVTICNPKSSTTKALIDLSQKSLVTEESVQNTSRQMNDIVHNGTLTTKHDIDLITGIVTNVVNSDHVTAEVTENVIGSIDETLDYGSLIVQANQEWNSSNILLNKLETLAQKQSLSDANQSRIVSKKHLALTVVNPIRNRPIQFYFVRSESEDVQVGSTQDGDIGQLPESSITIPQEVISNTQGHLIYSYTFLSDALFLREDSQSNATNRSIVQSVVMSASIGNISVNGLTTPIEMLFTPNVLNVRGTSACKFWNFSLVDPVTGVEGGWSAEGCVTSLGEIPNQIRCQCDHLTNFAIILDVDQSGSNPLALQIISWIGCGVSLAGLFLTVVTFTIIPTVRKKLPSKILISLSLSLMGLLLVFLVGVEKTESRIGCQVVAGMLHYFTLASFCWMAVEGLNLYRNFVKVFRQTGSSSRFLMKISAFGWGLPLLIVVVSGASASNLYGPETDDDPQYCVVRGTAFYFALLLPVASIMLGNLIVLFLVLRGIKDGSKLSKDTKKGENAKLVQLRIAFACSVLLGSTWIFAILAVGNLRDFFQWLFCIFNSLQGFFIFVFYCLRNKEVRRQWMNCFGGRGFERSSTMKSMYFSRYNSFTAHTAPQASTLLLDHYKLEPVNSL